MTFHIADITKPLASAGYITATEHGTVLGVEDAYAQRRVKLHKKSNIIVMRVRTSPELGSPQNDACMGVVAMCESDFTRQED